MKFSLVVIFFLSIFSISGNAQDLVPDEISSDPSSKCYKEVFFEPGSKTVITAEEIVERGYDNLDELLASVPGIHLTHDRTFTQIGFRGVAPTVTNNHRVKVFLDGLPINNPMTGQAPSGYDFRGINPEDLKEVDERINAVVSGVESVQNDMLKIFSTHGIQKIEPLDEKFDANFHEVMFEGPAPDKAAGTIIQVIETGYVLNGRILRPARVGVAKNEGDTPEPPPTQPGGSIDTEA